MCCQERRPATVHMYVVRAYNYNIISRDDQWEDIVVVEQEGQAVGLVPIRVSYRREAPSGTSVSRDA